jgi:hypothetical protein
MAKGSGAMKKSNMQIELECFRNWRENMRTLKPTRRNIRRVVAVARQIYWLEDRLGLRHD